MIIRIRIWAILLLCGIAGGAFAQSLITGRIVSATDNEPIIGASVSLPHTNGGVTTDVDGTFRIGVKELPVTL